MHPERFQGPASYSLTKEENEIFFEALFSIKAPSGFSSNIKGIINRDFYFRAPGSLVVLSFPQPLNFSSVFPSL
jgi:hypothetical protein